MPAGCKFGKHRLSMLVLVLALGLVCAGTLGCSVVKGTITTLKALNDAGFTNVQLTNRPGNLVEVRVRRDVEDLSGAARTAGEIVWRNLPLPIDSLRVVCENGFGGSEVFAADRPLLEASFGARDPALDRGVQTGDLRAVGIAVLVALIVGFVVLIAIVVGIVLLVRRSKRRSQPPPPPAYPGGPPPPYHPPS